MQNLLLIIFILVSLSSASASKKEVDSLLHVLDAVISERAQYAKAKELKIEGLKQDFDNARASKQSYLIYQEIFKEYRNYNLDSALFVANKQHTLSSDLQEQGIVLLSQMNTAEILGKMGMYKESLDIISQIKKQELEATQWAYYFHLHHAIYTLMSENSLSSSWKKHYGELISQYKDSLLLSNERGSLGYQLVKSGKLIEHQRYDEALDLMEKCYQQHANNEEWLGILAHVLSVVYNKKGDLKQEEKYLAISAIADLRLAVKGYIALPKLAAILYKEGDVDRAYAYIKCSMEDATFCKARFRTLEIAETLPIISAAYNKKEKEERGKLIKYLFLISILSIILVFSVLYIYKQLKRLSSAKKSMNKMCDDLKQMNDSLNELNKKLSESNLVKETYIGSIFSLCSTYIDKMETYRISINRKIKSGQIEDASRMTSSSSLVSDELREFFCNFDAIFLNIYPNFIDEFNALLTADKQITPKAGDILTPELRVFALVRLGISDSSKIASFLHYSPQTVYNYKLKVKNKLIVSKEEFAISIQKIGK